MNYPLIYDHPSFTTVFSLSERNEETGKLLLPNNSGHVEVYQYLYWQHYEGGNYKSSILLPRAVAIVLATERDTIYIYIYCTCVECVSFSR